MIRADLRRAAVVRMLKVARPDLDLNLFSLHAVSQRGEHIGLGGWHLRLAGGIKKIKDIGDRDYPFRR